MKAHTSESAVLTPAPRGNSQSSIFWPLKAGIYPGPSYATFFSTLSTIMTYINWSPSMTVMITYMHNVLVQKRTCVTLQEELTYFSSLFHKYTTIHSITRTKTLLPVWILHFFFFFFPNSASNPSANPISLHNIPLIQLPHFPYCYLLSPSHHSLSQMNCWNSHQACLFACPLAPILTPCSPHCSPGDILQESNISLSCS